MNVGIEKITIEELKNKFGTYLYVPGFGAKKENIFLDQNESNFIKLLNVNISNINIINKIDFLCRFLNKNYKDQEVKVYEELNIDKGALGTAKNIEGIYRLIELKIDSITKQITRSWIDKREKRIPIVKFISSIMSDVDDKKEAVIINNKDSYKNNDLHYYLNIKIIPLEYKVKGDIIAPKFIKNMTDDEYITVYSIVEDSIIESKDNYISSINIVDNSLILNIQVKQYKENIQISLNENKDAFEVKNSKIHFLSIDKANELIKKEKEK